MRRVHGVASIYSHGDLRVRESAWAVLPGALERLFLRMGAEVVDQFAPPPGVVVAEVAHPPAVHLVRSLSHRDLLLHHGRLGRLVSA